MERITDHENPGSIDASGPSADGREKRRDRSAPMAKAFRAATAVVVFGVPLLVGTAAVLGYGVYKAYKGITDRS